MIIVLGGLVNREGKRSTSYLDLSDYNTLSFLKFKFLLQAILTVKTTVTPNNIRFRTVPVLRPAGAWLKDRRRLQHTRNRIWDSDAWNSDSLTQASHDQ